MLLGAVRLESLMYLETNNQDMFWGEHKSGSRCPSDQRSAGEYWPCQQAWLWPVTLRSFVSLNESVNHLSASASALEL